jgi:DNA-binding LacI/PurR family transcriptional regulator
MTAAGLEIRPEWQITADFTVQGAYSAARRLLGSAAERPTAVFAASDEMAIGTILAARDFGLQVPQDLSVVGMDGHELGETFGLTTVDQAPAGRVSWRPQLRCSCLRQAPRTPPADQYRQKPTRSSPPSF